MARLKEYDVTNEEGQEYYNETMPVKEEVVKDVDVREAVARGIATSIGDTMDGAGQFARSLLFRYADGAIDTLKSLGWLSPADLEARDKAVRDTALEMAKKAVRDYQALSIAREWIVDWDTAVKHIQANITALKSTPTRFQEVPEGYVVVPVEPTEAMIKAGWIDKEDVNPEEIYRAMLTAVTVKP